MRHYSFGNAQGRFIGNTEKYSVYDQVISNRNAYSPTETYKNLPGEFTFAYGPATGGLLESVGFDIHTPGELIKHIEVDPYYKTRTLKVRGLTPQDALLIVERLNGFHAISNSIAFEMAVEDALDLEVSEEVWYSRLVMLELERIRSNLEVVKRLCEPSGFGVPQHQVAYLRENVARIISRLAGHRYFFSASSIGGCQINGSGIETLVTNVRKEFEDIFESLLQSKIFLNRIQNNGVVKRENLLGPAARAAGLN
ncbi:MAG: Ni,Fe-hydrogenase III large subunit, partial [Thermoplasmataceae archaeon]